MPKKKFVDSLMKKKWMKCWNTFKSTQQVLQARMRIKSSKKAMELYQYLNNKDGLLPYDKRGINIPAPEKGILYKRNGN